jgi:major membrane immunogen (membrane-anchored lipoprotein)
MIPMKRITPVLMIIALLFTACNSSDKSVDNDKYEQSKETLKETESKNPRRFLTVKARDRKNLIGEKVVKGVVTNNAKVAAFKDVEIEISYYSKTGAFLMSSTDKVYDVILPGKSADFKNREFAPKGTDSVAVKILSAKPGE